MRRLRRVGIARSAQTAKNDYGDGKTWLCRPGRAGRVRRRSDDDDRRGGRHADARGVEGEPERADRLLLRLPDGVDRSRRQQRHERRARRERRRPRAAGALRVAVPRLRAALPPGDADRAARRRRPAARSPSIARSATTTCSTAWNHYLQHDNNGRGVVLIGHSQGSGVLTQLIRNEIDGKPVQSKLISALLLGTSLAVPKGKDVGGAFQHIPLCHSATQTGCVIAYASFRSTIPPPENSRFGRVQGENMQAACVNPAALGGGSGELHAYLVRRAAAASSDRRRSRAPWVTPAKPIDTPFVSVPGLLTAQCVANEQGLVSRGHGARQSRRSARRRHRRRRDGQRSGERELGAAPDRRQPRDGQSRRHRPRAGEGVSRAKKSSAGRQE